MPAHQAILGVLGSSHYAFNTQLSSLLYFKIGSGLLNPAASLVALILMLLLILAFLASLGVIAWIAGQEAGLKPGNRGLIAVALFAGVAVVLGIFWPDVPWLELPRPLPVVMVGLGIAGLMRWRRSLEPADLDGTEWHGQRSDSYR